MAEPAHDAPALPLAAGERLAWLDAARGFALLGVLAVNLTAMASAEWLYRLAGAPRDVPLWDDAADLARDALLYGRSLALLSILFGFGIGVVTRTFAHDPRGARRRHLRRMAFLGAVGLVDSALVWFGDILLPYALAGLAVTLGLRAPARVLVAWAVGILATLASLAVLGAGLVALGGAADDAGAVAAAVGEARAIEAVYLAGDHVEVVRTWAAQPEWFLRDPVTFGLVLVRTVALVLLGLAVQRSGIVGRDGLGPRVERAVLLGGLAVGVPATALEVWATRVDPGGTGAASLLGLLGFAVGAPALAGAYAVLLLGWWRRRGGGYAGRCLVALGRTTFTCYLAQNVGAVLLFTLLGGYGRLGPLGLLVLAVAIVALQAVWAERYLRRHAQGPLEAVWRRATYR